MKTKKKSNSVKACFELLLETLHGLGASFPNGPYVLETKRSVSFIAVLHGVEWNFLYEIGPKNRSSLKLVGIKVPADSVRTLFKKEVSTQLPILQFSKKSAFDRFAEKLRINRVFLTQDTAFDHEFVTHIPAENVTSLPPIQRLDIQEHLRALRQEKLLSDSLAIYKHGIILSLFYSSSLEKTLLSAAGSLHRLAEIMTAFEPITSENNLARTQISNRAAIAFVLACLLAMLAIFPAVVFTPHFNLIDSMFPWPLLPIALLCGTLIACLLWSGKPYGFKRLQMILIPTLFLAAFLHPSLYFGIQFVNDHFDRSKPQIYISTVSYTISRGKGGGTSVVLSDPQSPGKKIFLPESHLVHPQGLTILPNLPVKMILRKGALGFRWIEKAEILPN